MAHKWTVWIRLLGFLCFGGEFMGIFYAVCRVTCLVTTIAFVVSSDQLATGLQGAGELDCPEILSNDQTTLQINGIHYMSVATYTCLVGHYPVKGDFNRTCQNDGTWSGRELICSKKCDQPEVPNGGDVNITGAFPGDTTAYTCREGYTLVGTSQRTCTEEGVWNSTTPECKQDCGQPDVPDGGKVTITGSFLNDTATYMCVDGYNLVGSSQRTCTENGVWKDAVPECTKEFVIQTTPIVIGSLGSLIGVCVIAGLIGKIRKYGCKSIFGRCCTNVTQSESQTLSGLP